MPTLNMNIFHMCSAEQKKSLVAALCKNININKKNEYGVTSLMNAIIAQESELAQILIDLGADINTKDNEGWTPLMYAIMYNDPITAKALINAGANIDAKNNEGFTPLMYCIKYADNITIDIKTEIAKSLIAAGADVYAKNNDGCAIFDFGVTEALKELYVPPIMGRLGLKKQRIFHNEILSDPVFQFKLSETKKRLQSKPKTKSISGVVVADKIAEMIRSGKIMGDVTPEKGKKLRGQIAHEMMMAKAAKTTQR